MTLDRLLAELQEVDRRMGAVATGDLEEVAALLPHRGELVAAIAAALSEEQPQPGHEAALEASVRAGMAAQRGVIVARHLIASEMGLAGQRQRLSSELAFHSAPPGRRLDLQG